MNKQNILKTVVNYCLCNNKDLEGALNGEQFLKISGASISERGYDEESTVYGYSIDILANLIEKRKFFGWYISENPDQASNSSNAKIIPLNKFRKNKIVEVKGEVHKVGRKGLIEMGFPVIKQIKYMDPLRTKEDFLRSAILIADFEDFAHYNYLKDITEKNYPNIVDRLFR